MCARSSCVLARVSVCFAIDTRSVYGFANTSPLIINDRVPSSKVQIPLGRIYQLFRTGTEQTKGGREDRVKKQR